jgi:hypothetical protein
VMLEKTFGDHGHPCSSVASSDCEKRGTVGRIKHRHYSAAVRVRES